MFQKYFMVSYQRHKLFCPISVFKYYQTTMWVFFWRNHFSVFFNKANGTISYVAVMAQTLSFFIVKTWVATNTRHFKNIFAFFCCLLQHIYNSMTVRQSNIGTSHFVLFETKPKKMCCLWQCVYGVYDNFSMLCMTIILYFVW